MSRTSRWDSSAVALSSACRHRPSARGSAAAGGRIRRSRAALARTGPAGRDSASQRCDHRGAPAIVRGLALFLADEHGMPDRALADLQDAEAFLAGQPKDRQRRPVVLGRQGNPLRRRRTDGSGQPDLREDRRLGDETPRRGRWEAQHRRPLHPLASPGTTARSATAATSQTHLLTSSASGTDSAYLRRRRRRQGIGTVEASSAAPCPTCGGASLPIAAEGLAPTCSPHRGARSHRSRRTVSC